jgi:predicted cupin superfamily sugar epimerase
VLGRLDTLWQLVAGDSIAYHQSSPDGIMQAIPIGCAPAQGKRNVLPRDEPSQILTSPSAHVDTDRPSMSRRGFRT